MPQGPVVSKTTQIYSHSFRLLGSWGSPDNNVLMWESDRCRHGMQQKGILAPRLVFRFAARTCIFLHVFAYMIICDIDICCVTRLSMLNWSMLYLVSPCKCIFHYTNYDDVVTLYPHVRISLLFLQLGRFFLPTTVTSPVHSAHQQPDDHYNISSA